jgi:hypothetical protein
MQCNAKVMIVILDVFLLSLGIRIESSAIMGTFNQLCAAWGESEMRRVSDRKWICPPGWLGLRAMTPARLTRAYSPFPLARAAATLSVSLTLIVDGLLDDSQTRKRASIRRLGHPDDVPQLTQAP